MTFYKYRYVMKLLEPIPKEYVYLLNNFHRCPNICLILNNQILFSKLSSCDFKHCASFLFSFFGFWKLNERHSCLINMYYTTVFKEKHQFAVSAQEKSHSLPHFHLVPAHPRGTQQLKSCVCSRPELGRYSYDL